MKRILLCVVVGVAFAAWRVLPSLPSILPDPAPVVVPASGLTAIAQRMTKDERAGMAEAYRILARMVAANPEKEPVFVSTADIREAHRAAMLAVWRGVLANQPGKYEGLREQLEGAIEQRIGRDELTLTPTLQQEAVRAFQEIAAAFAR